MRIALLTIGFPPDTSAGGIATLYWQLARALRNADHEVLVVCSSAEEDSEYQVDGVRVIRAKVDSKVAAIESLHRPLGAIQTALPLAFDMYDKSIARLIEFTPDVIESPDYLGMGLLFALDGRFPVITRCMGPFSHMMQLGLLGSFSSLDQTLVASMEESALRASAALTSLSQNLATLLCARFNLPCDAIEPGAAPYENTPELNAPPAGAVAPGGFPRLVFWGRVEYLKGCDLLVEALAHVLNTYPQAGLTLVGKSSSQYYDQTDYAQRLSVRASELGVKERVKFIGEINRLDAAPLVAASDICVFPSRYDTSPYAVIEAMAHGACVLSTEAGGIPEYVEHGVSGWLVPPNDAAALADAIVRLSSDNDLRARLKQNAPRRIQNYCNPQSIAIKTVEIYRRAADYHKKRPLTRHSGAEELFRRLRLAFSDSSIEDYMSDRIKDVATESFEQGYLVGYKAAQSNAPGPPAD